MSELEKNQEVSVKRKNVLKDDEQAELKVTASLRDQQLKDLTDKLIDQNAGDKIVGMWHRANADRSEWLERQNRYLQEVDEFINPIYPQALDWSANLHLPTILTVCKTFHARMLAALIDVDPPFTVRSRKAANGDRAMLVEELMRYTLKDWCNENQGVEEQLDRWVWNWVTAGVGILKARWNKKFTRFKDVDVEEVQELVIEVDPMTGEGIPTTRMAQVEREVTRTEEVFNGPMLERIPFEDVVIVGGEGDPQKADAVMHQSWYTASELWSLVDQKVFREDAVKKIIKSGKDYILGNDQTSAIKMRQVEQGGMSNVDKDYALDRYKIIEAYVKIDVDGSGIASDLIVWVHEATNEIVRATYLRRVMPTGLVPFFKIDFHLRHGTEYGVGLVEMLYTLGKEIDAMHNINLDIGILTSMPIGFYRPTAASLKDERLPLEPGALIPVDQPSQDIYFPNMGARTGFGFQEQSALQLQIERLTSISDLNLGIVSGQGATRTATGTRALLGESSNNLSVFIKRMNRGWRRALRYIFCMLQYRLEPGFQFRVLGDDGNAYWRIIESRKELEGHYDFEVEANSANSNKQVQIEQANMIYQMTQNPIDLQLGLITPAERYEAVAYMLKVNGIKDVSKFLRKPDQAPIKFQPIEIANRVLAGIDTPLDPTQDLQGFIAVVEEIMNDEVLNGQFNPTQISLLQMKAQEAIALMQAMEAAQQQQIAASQQAMNSMAAQTPGNMQPVAVNQQPGQGEGG